MPEKMASDMQNNYSHQLTAKLSLLNVLKTEQWLFEDQITEGTKQKVGRGEKSVGDPRECEGANEPHGMGGVVRMLSSLKAQVARKVRLQNKAAKSLSRLRLSIPPQTLPLSPQLSLTPLSRRGHSDCYWAAPYGRIGRGESSQDSDNNWEALPDFLIN